MFRDDGDGCGCAHNRGSGVSVAVFSPAGPKRRAIRR
jgi:hypothetical protein